MTTNTRRPRYRDTLPQLASELFLTDGGLETTLIFHHGVDLPCFAAFTLLDTPAGMALLEDYFARYTRIALAARTGIVLEAPTWRANSDWGSRVGYDAAALDDINRRSIALLQGVRSRFETPTTPIVISGNLGPRGDGYRGAEDRMTVAQARDYHGTQIRTFADTAADMIAAFTMNYPEEAIGIALAAREAGMPAALSFTLETNGRLPGGETLREAIERTDEETGAHASYYLINCAHPSHFAATLAGAGDWIRRVRGLRANASRRSHAELDASTDLDAGDPQELGEDYRRLRAALPQLNVVGGCCGTDHRHVEAMCAAMQRQRAA